jgi:TolB-like protein/Flp pilus assembly protein TadD
MDIVTWDGEMASLIAELKRRNVFKVGVAYAIVAWLVIQIVNNFFPPLGLPEWSQTLVAALILIGFPFALLFAWAFELTPEGIKSSKSVESAESITHATGQKLNYTIIGLLALALTFVLVDNYLLEENEEADILPNSVAVLPFENLSPNPDNAYFAAGIHDTILNELAKIRDMNVIARTSVLQYADRQMPISQIAKDLNVEIVMEGTVQYAEGQVRITAQLIDPTTGSHLWSGNYDRNFEDLFVIQSEIAEHIATAVKAEIMPSERQSLQKTQTTSSEALTLYLQVKSYGSAWRSDLEVRRIILSLLDKSIELDPEFALAYAYRAEIHQINNNYDAAIQDAERALILDPAISTPHIVMGHIHYQNYRDTEAQEEFDRALQISPNDSDVLMEYAVFKSQLGRHVEAIDLARQALVLDPNNPVTHFRLARRLWLSRDFASAAGFFRTAIELRQAQSSGSITTWSLALAIIENALGNTNEARDALALAVETMPQEYTELPQLAYVYSRLGQYEDASRIFNQLHNLSPGEWIEAYLAIGDEDEALIQLNIAIESRQDRESLVNEKYNSYADPVLDKPEFLEARRKLGFSE